MTEQMDWLKVIESKLLKPHEVDCVVYHHPCSDGFGAAYAAWKFSTFSGKEITFFPMNVGAHPPAGLEGKNVLVCDYSYKKDIVIELLKKVNKLLIIDHHLSAEKDLKDIDDNLKIFRMDYSGAMLTWYYFFPEQPPPLMIQYIQDRDIWTKKLPNTDDFASWFYTLPFEFQEYDKYVNDNLLMGMINTRGVSFGELNNYYTQQAVDYCVPKFCRIKDKFYFVGYVNSTVCKSDIGNKIFDKYPLIDFSATYSISDATDSTSFSLRSTQKHANVSEIAFSLGGGGHKCSAGIRVDYVTNRLPGVVYDNGQLYKLLDNIYFNKVRVDNQEYNIAYLNSMTHKFELANYLIQNKYIDENNNHVRVAENLYTKYNQVEQCKISIAVILHYNTNNDITEYNVIFDNSIDKKIKTDILNKYISNFNNDKFITFSVNGLQKFL